MQNTYEISEKSFENKINLVLKLHGMKYSKNEFRIDEKTIGNIKKSKAGYRLRIDYGVGPRHPVFLWEIETNENIVVFKRKKTFYGTMLLACNIILSPLLITVPLAILLFVVELVKGVLKLEVLSVGLAYPLIMWFLWSTYISMYKKKAQEYLEKFLEMCSLT